MATRKKKVRRPYQLPPKKAVIYVRVSTDEQAASGLGLEAQEAACRRACLARDLDVVKVCRDEGISGREGLEGRPGLAEAVRLADEDPQVVVVVYSVTRLARTQRMLVELLDPDGDIKLQVLSTTETFDTTTGVGRAMFGMIAVFSQLEVDLISERTKAALAERKAKGLHHGGNTSMIESYIEGERRIDPKKVARVREVQSLYKSGRFTYKTLLAHLNDNGIPSVTGKRWHNLTLNQALHIQLPEDM